VIDAIIAHGDETAIASRLREHLAAGADHVLVNAVGPDLPAIVDMLERIAPGRDRDLKAGLLVGVLGPDGRPGAERASLAPPQFTPVPAHQARRREFPDVTEAGVAGHRGYERGNEERVRRTVRFALEACLAAIRARDHRYAVLARVEHPGRAHLDAKVAGDAPRALDDLDHVARPAATATNREPASGRVQISSRPPVSSRNCCAGSCCG